LDFWTAIVPFVYCEEVLSQTAQEVESILASLNSPSKLEILDAACGIGRHSVEFAKRGYRVDALDNSSDLLEVGKKNTSQNVTWINQNLKSFSSSNSYDLVCNLYYSFGFVDPEDSRIDETILSNFFHSLKGGGTLVMQLIGRDAVETYFHPKFWIRKGDNLFLLNQRNMNYESGVLHESFFLLDDGEVSEYVLETRLYYPDQIKQILENMGFININLYGDWNRSSYTEKSSFLLVVAQKPLTGSSAYLRC
jgi:SAM-dependent methyltransferase